MAVRTRNVVMAGCFAALLCCASRARADKFDSTLDVAAQVTGGLFEPNPIKLHPTGDAPPSSIGTAPIETRTFGILLGGGAKLGLTLRHWRFGIGAGAASIQGLRWVQPGLRVGEGSTFAVPLEGWVGYGLCCSRQFRPYVDLRISDTLLVVRERVIDRDGTELGTTYYSGSGWSLAPRLGVRGLLNTWLFADFGASIGVVGPETLLLTLSLGLPIPTANL